MSSIHDMLQIYIGMRSQGIAAKRALEILRPQINVFSHEEQLELVRQVRQWETQAENQAENPPPKTETRPKIKPIGGSTLPKIDSNALKNAARTLPVYEPGSTNPKPLLVPCPNCGRQNRSDEVICFACGHLMVTGDTQAQSTRDLGDVGTGRDSFFGSESILVLLVRGSNMSFKVRPQRQNHELIVGRGDQSIKPDIDLNEFGAATMGVSRMHVTLRYDPKHAHLTVTDMNTVNGTFINGVKLLPQEVRVLRHNDELRLGQLILTVHFYFAEG